MSPGRGHSAGAIGLAAFSRGGVAFGGTAWGRGGTLPCCPQGHGPLASLLQLGCHRCWGWYFCVRHHPPGPGPFGLCRQLLGRLGCLVQPHSAGFAADLVHRWIHAEPIGPIMHGWVQLHSARPAAVVRLRISLSQLSIGQSSAGRDSPQCKLHDGLRPRRFGVCRPSGQVSVGPGEWSKAGGHGLGLFGRDPGWRGDLRGLWHGDWRAGRGGNT
mmetsp:Transcript_71609/g.185943  ORF Transcript_71609/g.185943 Transcript_71609/m.185943 type:complete len:215 (-) Transcript_71609:3-647(-)